MSCAPHCWSVQSLPSPSTVSSSLLGNPFSTISRPLTSVIHESATRSVGGKTVRKTMPNAARRTTRRNSSSATRLILCQKVVLRAPMAASSRSPGTAVSDTGCDVSSDAMAGSDETAPFVTAGPDETDELPLPESPLRVAFSPVYSSLLIRRKEPLDRIGV